MRTRCRCCARSSERRRTPVPSTAVRRYHVTTFGCQMNAHDSERIKGMLESLGLGEAADQDDADVLVFNTCTIREKPDTKLAAYLGRRGRSKARDPSTVVAVGGCYAEAQRERIFELYPFVDVAFGPGLDPASRRLARRRRRAVSRAARFGTRTSALRRPTLPMHRERRFQAWVQVSMGCNSRVLVLHRPGRARPRGEPPARARSSPRSRRSPREGVREVTLLGQNVNSYGRDLAPDGEPSSPSCCAPCDAVEGIERIRFTSPHPKDFRAPRDRRDGRVRRGLRARAPAAPVRLDAGPQGDAAHLLARALPAARRASCATAIPDLALDDRHHRRLPGRDRGRLRGDARGRRGGRLRRRLHLRLLAARRAPRRPRCPTRCREDVKRERIERLVEVVQRVAARAERASASGASRRCSSRGRAGRTRRCSAGARGGTRR